MKVTYVEEINSRTALSRKMFCPVCGSHGYKIIHTINPEPKTWRIECEQCDYSTEDVFSKSLAKLHWEYRNGYDV